MIATAASDGVVSTWLSTTARPIATWRLLGENLGQVESVNCLCASSDGTFLYSGGQQGSVRAFQSPTTRNQATPIAPSQNHNNAVTALSLSSDDKLLATASKDTSVRVFNARTLEELHVLRGHESLISDCCFSPNDQTLLVSSYDKTCTLWELSSGQRKLDLIGCPTYVEFCSFAPDGTKCITYCRDGALKFFVSDTFCY